MRILTRLALLLVVLSLIGLVAFAVYFFPILLVLLFLGLLLLEFCFEFRKGARARALLNFLKRLLLDW